MLVKLSKIFIGPKVIKYSTSGNVIKKQITHIKNIWDDSKEASYGINRIFRLILCISAFIFPAIYIRHFFNKINYTVRKIAVEIYSILKLIFPILVLIFDWNSKFILLINFYLLFETLFYLLSLIFLSDVYSAPHSSKRSMILVILNYFEITFDFAVIYKLLNIVGVSSPLGVIPVENLTSSIAAYFSFIISTTIGFGDYMPTLGLGYKIVVFHASSILLFLILFINHFVNILNENRK